MNNEKLSGREFWNSNPIGGHWSSVEEKIKWAMETESYTVQLLTSELLKNRLVLDVGCGVGLYIPLVSKYAINVIGLDYSDISLREAKDNIQEMKIDNVHFIHGDAEFLPIFDNQLDVVYSLGVLHHTPNTAQAIDEIYRVLRPNGVAVVMLYKTYSPRWIVVKVARSISWVIDRLTREEYFIANKLRRKYTHDPDSVHGTALLELFGCPTLKTYSINKTKKLFSSYKDIHFQSYQPGFTRMLDFLPSFIRNSVLRNISSYLDIHTGNILGFYLVITARK